MINQDSCMTRRSFLGAMIGALGVASFCMIGPSAAHAAEDGAALPRSGVPYLTTWLGSDVYNTNQLIATNYFRSSDWVVVASGGESSWADSVVAAGVAGIKGAPVVLTPTEGLCKDAETSIRALGARNAYIIGGTACLSADVENRLHAIFGPEGQVRRLAGPTLYETAEAAYSEFSVNQWVNPGPLGNWRSTGGKRVAILVRSDTFHDGMSAGSLAYEAHYPVLFVTPTGEFTNSTQDILRNGEFDEVYGIGLVSQDILDAAQSLSGASATRRLSGAESWDTSALVFEAAMRVDKVGFTHVSLVDSNNSYDGRSVFGVKHGILLVCADDTGATHDFMCETGWMCDGIMSVGPLSSSISRAAELGWWDGRIHGGGEA